MARVRSSGNKTTEERMVKLLREAGLKGWRRRLPLPGSPDFAWPALKVALFVDGCFWHGHDCGKNISPRTNADAWKRKIENNRRRDRKVSRQLRAQGWSVLRIWECRLKSHPDACVRRIRRAIEARSARRISDHGA
jgi:DNA mismatch endonuclease (patch repair protein)